MDSVARIGQASFKALSHPAKERLDGSFRTWAIRRGLLCDDAKPIHEHLPCTLGGEDLAPVMEDDGRFAITGPGMFTSSEADEAIFWLQCLLHQAHVVLLLERAEGENCA